MGLTRDTYDFCLSWNSDSNKNNLASRLEIFPITNNDEKINKLARAAVNEYVNLLEGTSIPSTINEFRVERLYCLIKHNCFAGLPSEYVVAKYFHITETQARTLLRNTLARHREDLRQTKYDEIKAILAAAERAEEENLGYEVVINSKVILDEIKDLVAMNWPTLPKITKKRDSSLYLIKPDTYEKLSEFINTANLSNEVAASKAK